VRRYFHVTHLKTYWYFNPRTREGCDLQTFLPQAFGFDFNPRTREGCDKKGNSVGTRTQKISIHAPAKGATCHDISPNSLLVFQSTHPRRVRPELTDHCWTGGYDFNPRTREGCD